MLVNLNLDCCELQATPFAPCENFFVTDKLRITAMGFLFIFQRG